MRNLSLLRAASPARQVLMGGLIDGINAEIPDSGKGWTKDLLSPIEQGLKAQVRLLAVACGGDA